MIELLHAIACAAALATAPQQTPQTPAAPSQQAPPLRNFVVAKPPDAPPTLEEAARAPIVPTFLPTSRDRLQVALGVGYLQDADWGYTLQSGGAVGGVHIGLDSLMTSGPQGPRFERGVLTVSDPDRGWRADAGDMFSPVRGATLGLRYSWRARGNRRPAVSVYGTRPGADHLPTIFAYRDQIRFAGQTILDAEVATDRSSVFSTEWTFPHLSIGASYRDQRTPVRAIDRAYFVDVPIWRTLGVGGSILTSDIGGERATWHTVAVRVPVARWLQVTLERTFTKSGGITSETDAIAGSLTARNARFFHRHQWGGSIFMLGNSRENIERQQIQSMASYDAGSRVQLTLQMATGWAARGAPQHWEELQTAVRLSRTTTFQVVTALPKINDKSRLRARVVQLLPASFAIEAEFGRLSAFQAYPNELDRARARLMVSRAFGFNTPARGGEVRGRVVDHAGRPVSGARVLLGGFSTVSDQDGTYAFRYVPRGEYDLQLDGAYLPAAYAWDGRQVTLNVTPTSRASRDLLVAPLNAVHGRVYVDKNSNGRFDAGEGVRDIVMRLDDRAIATGEDGAYSFYNVWPGPHVVRLDASRLPATVVPVGEAERAITLGDDSPVRGVDFKLTVTTKPIQWRGIGRGAGK